MWKRFSGKVLLVLALCAAVVPGCPNAEPWGWGTDHGEQASHSQSTNREERSVGDGGIYSATKALFFTFLRIF